MEELQPKLRFPEFDEDWNQRGISEICELTSSKRVYLSDYVQAGVPFYRGKEISELKAGKFPTDILYISEEAYYSFKEKFGVPNVNDILMTAVGTLGNTLRIKDDSPFYFKDGNLIWFRKISENSSFLEILLNLKNDDIQKTSIGSTQRALTMVELRKLRFLFPSLPEQTKIATFLSAVDEKLNLLKEKKEALEEYKKGMMQKIFSQEIRFKDDNGKEFAEWEEKSLGEIGEIITGKTPSTKDSSLWDGDIQFITPTDINENKYQFFSARTIQSNSKLKLLPPKSLLYTCIASIGKMSLSVKPCITNQQINSIIPNKEIDNEFLYYAVLEISDFIKSTPSSSTLPIINKTEFSKFKIHLPCLAEQTKIASFLSAIDEKIALVSMQIEETQEYKKGLLQQMFC